MNRLSLAVGCKIAKEQTCGPSLKKDLEGNLIYYYGNKYVGDLMNSAVNTLVFEKLGNHFMSKFEKYGEKDGREVYSFYFNDRKIGEFLPNNIKTNRGYIAVEFRRAEKDDVYPVGIKVWNDLKKDWITFDIDWLPTVIGWVE